MITIIDKHNCCGCSSCVQRCPKQCITLQQDKEGFLYPHVDTTTCIDCGLCEKVCPYLVPQQECELSNVFAAKNPDEAIRKESSSGGIFTMLAVSIVHEGGVVFGARWGMDWNVVHSYTESVEGIKAFRSSKYVQSNINDSYQKAEAFLKEGRKVLFSGTPCQIAGLKSFLRKEYDNLISAECVCHGVPSPCLWQKYLAEVSKGKEMTFINHRDKRTGWRNYSVVIKFADGEEIAQHHDNNPWIRAFIKNLTLRPSCYTCQFKCKTSFADITLGDLWGDRQLLPEQDENKGITLVIANTLKGDAILKEMQNIKDLQFSDVVCYNTALVSSPYINDKRKDFFTMMNKGKSFIKSVNQLTKDPLTLRIKIFIKKFIKTV